MSDTMEEEKMSDTMEEEKMSETMEEEKMKTHAICIRIHQFRKTKS